MKKIMINFINNFMEFTRINTTSDSKSGTNPSTENQTVLCKLVLEKLGGLGCLTYHDDETGVGYAVFDGNSNIHKDIALFAHLDTAPDWKTDTKARLVKYNGGDIVLNDQYTLSPCNSPELVNYVGQNIFVTDGTSLLGGDDKAAIAEIITFLEYIQENNVEHGKIAIALLPDEEIGLHGAKNLETLRLTSDFGICLDCCGIGEYVVENWNAAHIDIKITGKTAHPMNSKNNMENAIDIAHELMSYLPPTQRPCATEGKEGYFWVNELTGDTSKATMTIAIRDFDSIMLHNRIHHVISCIQDIHSKLVFGKIEFEVKHDYGNPGDSIKAYIADIPTYMEDLGIEPKPLIMRGGYDGSYISTCKNNLPTINIFTGGHNFHSNLEYLPLGSVEKAIELLIEIVANAV